MDDMIDLTAGDALLRRRLEAYAEARLTPDLATSSRLRAKVLAVAHRQADLARTDAALTILTGVTPLAGGSSRERLTADTRTAGAAGPRTVRADRAALAHAGRRPRAAWRRTASILLAASLGLGLITGTAFAARPGGPLYLTRVWAETLTLPTEPSARALAELQRLDQRLREAAAAAGARDPIGAAAALGAYETIMDEASTSAILAGDSVASAVLETGMGRNVTALQALAARVPDQAGSAIDRAIERAIDHSDDAIKAIGTGKPAPGGGGNGDGGNGGGSSATPKPTKAPTPEPATTPQPTTKPTKEPTQGSTPKPTKESKPEATPRPTPKAPDDPGKPDDAGKPDPTPRRTPPNHGGG
jgi:hypothetical protein